MAAWVKAVASFLLLWTSFSSKTRGVVQHCTPWMWPVTSRISITWEPVRNAESSLRLEPWNPKLHFTKFSRPFTCTWTSENCCHGPSLTCRPGLMLNAILSYSSCPCTCLHHVQNHNYCGFQWPGTNHTSLSSPDRSWGNKSVFSLSVSAPAGLWFLRKSLTRATAESREPTWWRGFFSWSGSYICKQRRLKLTYQWKDNGEFWFEQ